MAITALTAALLLASPLASHEDVAPQIPVTVPISASVVSTSPVAATALADTNPAPPDPINDIVVTGRAGPPPGDPLERVNEVTFSAVQAVDSAIIEPVAQAYEAAVPSPVRSGIRNFLGNLHEPETCLNFLLQHRIGKAFETFARFAINSTIGLAGLIDVAKRKPFNRICQYYGLLWREDRSLLLPSAYRGNDRSRLHRL
jgi:phospholipid-binding lipoprotein MlaA